MNPTGYYPTQEGGATFGEYATTTSINGVQSQFTPNIDPFPSTNQFGGYNIVSNEVTTQPSVDILQASGEGAAFGEYNTTTKINGVDSMFAENIDAQPSYGTYLESTPILNVEELQSNAYQTFESPIIETNEFQNIPGIDINTYQTSPIIDETLTQTQLIDTTPIDVTSPVLDTGLALDDLQFQNYETIQTSPTIPVTPLETPVNVIQTQPITVPTQKKITVTVPKKIVVPVPKIHKVYVPSSRTIQTSVPISQSILPTTQSTIVTQPLPTPQIPVSVPSVPTVPVLPKPVYTTSSVPAVPIPPRPVYATSSVPAVVVPPKPLYSTASITTVPVQPPRPVYTTTSVATVPVQPAIATVPVPPKPIISTTSVATVPVQPAIATLPVPPKPLYSTASVATVPVQPPMPVYSTTSIKTVQTTVPVTTIPSVQPVVIPKAQVPIVPATIQPIAPPLTTVPIQPVAPVPIVPTTLPQAPLPQVTPIAAGIRRPPVYNVNTYRPNLGTYHASTGARINMVQPVRYGGRTYNPRRL